MNKLLPTGMVLIMLVSMIFAQTDAQRIVFFCLMQGWMMLDWVMDALKK